MSAPGRTRGSLSFFPAVDGRGKWHVDSFGVNYCGRSGSAVLLDLEVGPMWVEAGTPWGEPHPFVCRLCLRWAGNQS